MNILNQNNLENYKEDIYELINFFYDSTERTENVLENLMNYINDNSAYAGGHVKDNHMVSFIWCHKREFGGSKRLHISYFIVSESQRGNGLSNDLITFARKTAQDLNINKIDLNVDPNNSAINLYHKLGFSTEKLQLVMDIGDEHV